MPLNQSLGRSKFQEFETASPRQTRLVAGAIGLTSTPTRFVILVPLAAVTVKVKLPEPVKLVVGAKRAQWLLTSVIVPFVGLNTV